VTVIATGFDQRKAPAPAVTRSAATPIIPLDPALRAARTPAAPAPGAATGAAAAVPPRTRPIAPRPIEDLSDMEIPTFIRRQMD